MHNVTEQNRNPVPEDYAEQIEEEMKELKRTLWLPHEKSLQQMGLRIISRDVKLFQKELHVPLTYTPPEESTNGTNGTKKSDKYAYKPGPPIRSRLSALFALRQEWLSSAQLTSAGFLFVLLVLSGLLGALVGTMWGRVSCGQDGSGKEGVSEEGEEAKKTK